MKFETTRDSSRIQQPLLVVQVVRLSSKIIVEDHPNIHSKFAAKRLGQLLREKYNSDHVVVIGVLSVKHPSQKDQIGIFTSVPFVGEAPVIIPSSVLRHNSPAM